MGRLTTAVLAGLWAPTAWANPSQDAAVVLSVGNYLYMPEDLAAEADGLAFEEWLLEGRGLRREQIVRLHNPSVLGMRDAIQDAANRRRGDGLLWVYLAGHGIQSADDGSLRLLAPGARLDFQMLEGQSLSLNDLQLRLSGTPSLLIADVGFSGVSREGLALPNAPQVPHTGPEPTRIGEVTIWIPQPTGVVPGYLPWHQRGLFTSLVLDAFWGAADGRDGAADGHVTLQEAQSWVAQAYLDLGRIDQRVQMENRADPAQRWMGDVGPSPLPLEKFGPIRPEPGPLTEDGVDPSWLNQAIASLQEQVQAQADADWSRTMLRVHRDPEEADAALRAFLDRYDARSYWVGEEEVLISADQVHEAKRRLRDTKPQDRRLRLETFEAGAVGLGLDADEGPEVALPGSFQVGSTEVPQSLWIEVMGFNPSSLRHPDRPVEGITWFEAVIFCNRLSAAEGLTPAYTIKGRNVRWDRAADGYRLPTEAEWVAMARRAYPDGLPEERVTCLYENVYDRTATGADPTSVPKGSFVCRDGHPATSPVGSRTPVHRLYDVGGNVAEWLWDAWQPQGASPWQDTPDTPANRRVVRGGAFDSGPQSALWALRRPLERTEHHPWLGLRLARTLDPEP